MAETIDVTERIQAPRVDLSNDVLRTNRLRIREMYEGLQAISVWPPEYGRKAPETILEIREFAKEILRKLDSNEI